MSDAAKRIAQNTAALFLGSVGKMVFSLVFVVAAARILGVKSYGGYGLAVFYGELFISLIASGLSILITREIAKEKNNDNVNQHLTAAVVLALALTALGMIALQIIPIALNYEPQTQRAIAIAALLLIPGALSMLLEATFIAFESAQYVTMGTVVEGIVRVACGLTALWLGYGIVALVIVLIGSRLCLLSWYLIALKRRVPQLGWSFQWQKFTQTVRNWKTFASENWLSNFANSIGVIILSAVHGEFAVGLLFATAKPLRLASVAAASYTAAVFPHMSRLHVESKEELDRLSAKSLKFMFGLALPFIVTLSVIADRVILILYSAEYAGAIPILRVAVWGLMLRLINPFLSHILFARGEQVRSLNVAVVRLGCHLLFACLLIPPFAAVGAAWASLLASIFACLTYMRFVWRGQTITWQATVNLTWNVMPAVSLAAFLVMLRDVPIIALLCLGAVLYVGLLLALRVVSLRDLRALQRIR